MTTLAGSGTAEDGVGSGSADGSHYVAKLRERAVDVSQEMVRLIEADWIDRDNRWRWRADPRWGYPEADGVVRVNEFGVTTREDAAGGCDGVKNGRWGFHTASGEKDPWWQVDLGAIYRLDRVVVFNRMDRNTAPRTRNLEVLVAAGPESDKFELIYKHDGSVFGGAMDGKPLVIPLAQKNVMARVVRLRVPGICSFALDEVEVYAADNPEENIALGKPADQKSVGRYSYPGTLPDGVDVASPPVDPHKGRFPAFSLMHCREVLVKAAELANRLEPRCTGERRNRLESLKKQMNLWEERLREAGSDEQVPEKTRREIYLSLRWIAREIAFCNPLLDFDAIVFIKRHDPAGVFHMCDQYYGCNAVPGGGLFALIDPFTKRPKLVDILDNSTVSNGRLAGQKLTGGSFLSPELSFDASTILFAYSEAKAWPKYQGKEAYDWAPEICYHIFRCRADGTDLQQLTDGAWDEFDPCFLPDGRIAFISMRRGGYLRCGRHCPVYTLFAMEADGSRIRPLSFHETHEWHPSVANDGMIVYTRWDYVDRDTNVAHHIWTCFPDGRNPRSPHGNYPIRRESRPWMEMQIRAIPESPKFVAVAAAHHGHEFGSLVLIDPRRVDDGAMSQLERLTPEVPFPEAEGRPINLYMVYGTPWPLSEEDFLCVYDAAAKNRGIYWIDRYDNKELLYRDPKISCSTPIPLRPRPVPPVLPAMTAGWPEDGSDPEPATVALVNVYDSDFRWPAGTKITALRVIQLLPKSTPPPNEPRIGVANQTNARAVLGTVPVEADGSAHFRLPPGIPVYFQALDERGMAVMSMRSVTYAHPGEKLVCQGCHEPRHDPPMSSLSPAIALTRKPSEIEPPVDGANPFNFVRLVQPVLDRHCVGCHREKNALDLSGVSEGPYGWTRSYTNLAGKYGFYYHVSNGSINQGIHGGSRTIAGQFGAAAAPLMKYLGPEHYGVALPAEDLHRIVLWLDCNSEFYGSYEQIEAQARGEIVWPSLK